MQLRPAVFLDRDGTLNENLDYLTRPEDMRLLPGVAPALMRLRAAGYACVVVTNQSAIGRGMIDEATLDAIHEEMLRQLAVDGAALDAIYASPHVNDHPDRKPAPGMLLQAAADLGLDLASSWMVGDSARDILAGRSAGCKGCVLVRTGHPIGPDALALDVPIVDDLSAAVDHILTRDRVVPERRR